jgi:nucleoside phosphorylase
MGWGNKFPDLKNDPTYLEPRLTAAETSLAQNTSQVTKINSDLYGNTNKSKGIAVTIQNATTTSTFSTWASKLSGLNCEIELCCMEYVSTSTSTDFTPVANIASLVAQAKSTLTQPITMLKPHIGTIALGDGFSRSGYNPSDINAFFTNWGARLQAYAQICKDNNIPVLCISCEQNNQTVNTYLSNWQTIINQCKAIYPSLQITVAYTITEFSRDIWQYSGQSNLMSVVDIIGLNFYPTLLRTDLMKYLFSCPDTSSGLATSNNNTGYTRYDQMLYVVKQQYNKKIYITETGCTNNSNSAATTIYPIYTGGSTDYTDQNTWLTTVLSYLFNNANVDGVYLWHIDSPFSVIDGSKSIIQPYMV